MVARILLLELVALTVAFNVLVNLFFMGGIIQENVRNCILKFWQFVWLIL